MTQEEKYKLALFAVVRNWRIMPEGLQRGKSMDEINSMARETVYQIMQMLDFGALKEFWEGKNE